MNNEDLNKIVNNRLEVIRDILVKKGIEYSNNGDRLINFKLGAKKAGWTPIEVLKGYMLKHEVSFDELCRTFSQTGKVDNKMIEEKITDLIAYLLLAECIMKEEQVDIKNQIEKLKEVHI